MRKAMMLLLAVCVGGCSAGGGSGDAPPAGAYPRARKPPYVWQFENASGPNLHGVGVFWKDMNGILVTAAAGDLRQGPKGIGKSDDEGWDPIPEQATIHWTTPDGERHEQQLSVAAAVPDIVNFRGAIRLIFHGNAWTVEASYESWLR